MSTFSAVRLRPLPSGEPEAILPGGLIGRLASAALRITDATVSEAHALVSLRGGALSLLSLRGTVYLRRGEGWTEERELVLAPGQQIRLGERAIMEVLDVVLPESELVLRLPDGLAVPLWPELALAVSLMGGPPWEIVPGFRPGAKLRFFNPGDVWTCEHPDGRLEELLPGTHIRVGDDRIAVQERPFHRVQQTTRSLRPGYRCRVDWGGSTCSGGQAELRLRGRPNELICELAARGPAGATSDLLSTLMWHKEDDPAVLSPRFHSALRNLRRSLAAAGLPVDLIRCAEDYKYVFNREDWEITGIVSDGQAAGGEGP